MTEQVAEAIDQVPDTMEQHSVVGFETGWQIGEALIRHTGWGLLLSIPIASVSYLGMIIKQLAFGHIPPSKISMMRPAND